MATLAKSPTGIDGFDQITAGGLPTGRPTLICGGAGCGKTLFAISFLVHGAVKFGEPGVFMSFEESGQELAQNVASLGFDLPGLIEKKKVVVDHVRVERSEIEETGDYDLEGLFIRLGLPSTRSAPSASFWTRSSRSSRAWPTSRSSAPSCAACSAG